MSSHSSPPSPPHKADTSDSFARRLATGLTIGIMLGIVLVPMIAVGILPAENTKWTLAAASEDYLNRDFDRAIERLDVLIESDPENDNLRMTRISWLLDADRAREAIAECTALIDKYPDGFFKVESAKGITDAFAHYSLRAEAYQQTGEFSSAADDWTTIVNKTEDFESSSRTNNAAYAHALANRDSFRWWTSMNKILGGNESSHLEHHMSGFLHFRFLREGSRHFELYPEERERVARRALDEFNSGIAAGLKLIEERMREEKAEAAARADQEDEDADKEKREAPSKPLIGPGMSQIQERELMRELDRAEESDEPTETVAENDDVPPVESELIEEDKQEQPKRKSVETLKQEVALIYAHLAMFFELIGDEPAAERAWARVLEMGRDPKEARRQELSFGYSMQHLATQAAWLDTRGFLMQQMGQHRSALKDLDRAVDMAEALLSGQQYQVAFMSKQTPDLRRYHMTTDSLKHQLSVLLFHRYQALNDLPKPDREAAARDAARIRELGFEVGASLH